MMQKFLNLLFAVLLVMACTASPGRSYPIKASIRDYSVFAPERELLPPEGNKSNIVLYDNINHPPSSNPQDRFFLPESDHFIPIDKFTSTPPLKIIIHARATTEDRIAGILYANLRLRMLAEEYKELQEKARRITKGLAVIDSGGQLTGSPLKGGDASSTQSIEQWRASLNQQARALANSEETSGATGTDELASFSGKIGDMPESPPEGDVNAQNGLETGSGRQAIALSETGNGLGGRSISSPVDNDLSGGYSRSLRPFDEKPQMPWAFKKVLEVMDYFNENKLEGIAYATILIGLTVIIAGLKPR